MHAIRTTTDTSTTTLSTNFVYEHPTITSLAAYVMTVICTRAGAMDDQTKPELIQTFLTRYATDFLDRAPNTTSVDPPPTGDVILITGTTGALGSATLANLIASESVGKIFALNRPSNRHSSVVERQETALRSRGYDPRLVKSPKLVLLEGDLSGAGLGIDTVIEEEVTDFRPILCSDA